MFGASISETVLGTNPDEPRRCPIQPSRGHGLRPALAPAGATISESVKNFTWKRMTLALPAVTLQLNAGEKG